MRYFHGVWQVFRVGSSCKTMLGWILDELKRKKKSKNPSSVPYYLGKFVVILIYGKYEVCTLL